MLLTLLAGAAAALLAWTAIGLISGAIAVRRWATPDQGEELVTPTLKAYAECGGLRRLDPRPALPLRHEHPQGEALSACTCAAELYCDSSAMCSQPCMRRGGK